MEGTEIRVPMAGKVIEVKKKVGDSVRKREIIAYLDAMKMKIAVFSSVDGVIQELNAPLGQILNKGHVLAIVSQGGL